MISHVHRAPGRVPESATRKTAANSQRPVGKTTTCLQTPPICHKYEDLRQGKSATVWSCLLRAWQKARCPRATSVTRYPRAVKNQIKSDQCSRNRKDQLRARTLRASPTFTCVTASWPVASAASWRSPRRLLLPSRPGAASSLSFAPALPTAAAAFRAAPRYE